MPRIASATALVAFAFAVVPSSTARADASVQVPSYSYEIENDPPPGTVLVVWPRACTASGEPLGTVDLTLNPDWTSRMSDVDYEVIVKGKTHVLLEPCTKTSRLYALPTDAFPLGARAATADDVSIGQADAGVDFAILPALDAIDRKKRMALFEGDKRVLRTGFRFEAEKAARSGGGRTAAVHEVLAVEGVEGDGFGVRSVRVVYTYGDGGSEAVWADAGARASAGPGAEASAGAGAGAGGGHDLGTRWVLLAALGGLVVGGALAYSRKKRAQK